MVVTAIGQRRGGFVKNGIEAFDGSFRITPLPEHGSTGRNKIRPGRSCGCDALSSVAGHGDAGDFNHLRPPFGKFQRFWIGIGMGVAIKAANEEIVRTLFTKFQCIVARGAHFRADNPFRLVFLDRIAKRFAPSGDVHTICLGAAGGLRITGNNCCGTRILYERNGVCDKITEDFFRRIETGEDDRGYVSPGER